MNDYTNWRAIIYNFKYVDDETMVLLNMQLKLTFLVTYLHIEASYFSFYLRRTSSMSKESCISWISALFQSVYWSGQKSDQGNMCTSNFWLPIIWKGTPVASPTRRMSLFWGFWSEYFIEATTRTAFCQRNYLNSFIQKGSFHWLHKIFIPNRIT